MIPFYILVYSGSERTTLPEDREPTQCYVAIIVDDPNSLTGDALIYNGEDNGLGDIELVITNQIIDAYRKNRVSRKDPIKDLPAVIYTGLLGTLVQRIAREGDIPPKTRVVQLMHLTVDEQRRINNKILEVLVEESSKL